MRNKKSIGDILEGLKHINESEGSNILGYLKFRTRLVRADMHGVNIVGYNAVGYIDNDKIREIYKRLMKGLGDLSDRRFDLKGINSMIRDVNNNLEEFRDALRGSKVLKKYPESEKLIMNYEDIIDDETDKKKYDIYIKLAILTEPGLDTGLGDNTELEDFIGDIDKLRAFTQLGFRVIDLRRALFQGRGYDIAVGNLKKETGVFLDTVKGTDMSKLSPELRNLLTGGLMEIVKQL